jgi:hypothetical protein
MATYEIIGQPIAPPPNRVTSDCADGTLRGSPAQMSIPFYRTQVLHQPTREISRFIAVSGEEGPAGGFEEMATSPRGDSIEGFLSEC